MGREGKFVRAIERGERRVAVDLLGKHRQETQVPKLVSDV